MKKSQFRQNGFIVALGLCTLMMTSPSPAGNNEWTSIGPDATALASVEWATDDAAWMESMDVVWRSSDGGTTWTRVGVLPGFGTICDFVPDVADSSRILIVNCGSEMMVLNSDGTYEQLPFTDTNHRGQTIAASGTSIYTAGQGTGVHVSNDGGQTWTSASNGLPFSLGSYDWIYELEASPVNAGYAWVTLGTDYEYYTHDGGANWQKTSNLPMATYAFAAHPTDATIVIAATSSGVYKSTDGGANWSPSTVNVTGRPLDVAFAASDGSVLYAATQEGDLFKSTDGADTWTEVGASIDAEAFFNVAASSSTGDVIASGWEGSFRSGDGGATWNAVTGIKMLDVNGFVQSFSNPDKLYLANYHAGVYVSNDDGESWTLERTGLDRIDINVGYSIKDLTINESHDTVFAASRGLYSWNAASADWQGPVTGTSGLVFEAVALNPTTPANIVAGFWTLYGGPSGIMTTVDGGANWSTPPELSDEWVTAVSFAPNDGNMVYAGLQGGAIWKSEDGGLSWTQVLAGDGYDQVNQIAVDPSNAARAFAVFGNALEDMRYTEDGGVSWNVVTDAGLNGMVHIAISPHDPDELLAASNVEGVLRSVDGGNTWKSINEGLLHEVTGAAFVAFDRDDPTRLIAGLDDLGLAEYTVQETDDSDNDDSGGDDNDGDDNGDDDNGGDDGGSSGGDDGGSSGGGGGGGGGGGSTGLLLLGLLGLARCRRWAIQANA